MVQGDFSPSLAEWTALRNGNDRPGRSREAGKGEVGEDSRPVPFGYRPFPGDALPIIRG
jgi:hypothetical protein